MSYTKNTWQCGDVVTADKLNNIEDGIEQALECCGGGSSSLTLTYTEEEVPCPNDSSLTVSRFTYSHSWQEIKDAFDAGAYVAVDMLDPKFPSGVFRSPIVAVVADDGEYMVVDMGTTRFFFADATSKVHTNTCYK